MENAIVNVNGAFLSSPSAPAVPVFDRSYLYGDSLYEVARTYQGKLYALNDHLVRLAQSAELCHLKLDRPLSHYRDECEKSVREFYSRPANRKKEAYCRIVISRGVGAIGFARTQVKTGTTYAIIVQPLNPPDENKWKTGYHFKIVERERNHPHALDPAMKSGNYLNSLLAFLEATDAGAEDALMCDRDGFMTEGSTFNIFYVKRNIVVTPPLGVGILEGITRRKILTLARKLGLETREVRFPPSRLFEADEVFMSSTIKEAFPVTKLSQGSTTHKIGNGKPGPITRQLKDAFLQSLPAELSIQNWDESYR